jgi:hypothetical protein
MREIAAYVAQNPSCAIAHEPAIYFVEALALLYGLPSGPEPEPVQLPFLPTVPAIVTVSTPG